MLDVKSQSQLTQATADAMCACALAASTSVVQSMTFWTRVMRSSLMGPASVLPAAWAIQAALPWHSENGAPDCKGRRTAQPGGTGEPAQQPAAELPNEPGFSSYRSSSGHAVAQVIVPEAT